MSEFDKALDRLFNEKPEREPPRLYRSWDVRLWQVFQGLVALIQVLLLAIVGFPLWLLLPIIVIYIGLQIFKRFTDEDDDYES